MNKLIAKKSQLGVTTVEYAIIAALVVGIAVVAFPTLKTALVSAFGSISTTLTNNAKT